MIAVKLDWCLLIAVTGTFLIVCKRRATNGCRPVYIKAQAAVRGGARPHGATETDNGGELGGDPHGVRKLSVS